MANKKILIIAEAGVNHNGKLKEALKMVDLASKAKADFVKFQTFDPEALVSAAIAHQQLGKIQHRDSCLKEKEKFKRKDFF